MSRIGLANEELPLNYATDEAWFCRTFGEKHLHYYQAIPKEYLGMSADALYDLVKPDFDLFRIKTRIWKHLTQHEEAPTVTEQIPWGYVLHNIYNAKEALEDHILSKPKVLAWLCKMPVTYEERLEECFEYGLMRFKDILSFDFKKKDGELNSLAVTQFLKTMERMEVRLHGAPATNINIKMQKQVSHTRIPAPRDLNGVIDVTALETRIKQLEHEKSKQLNVLDVPTSQTSPDMGPESRAVEAVIMDEDDN